MPPPTAGGGTRRLPVVPIDLRLPRRLLQPERQLMAAVLVDAVATWRRCREARDPGARSRLAEVVAWLEDPSAAWLFSFARICGELDLDAPRIRRMLRGGT